MLRFLGYFVLALFEVFGAVLVDFVFWDFFCGYRWKETDEPPKNLTGYWMNRAIEAERRLRDAIYKSRQENEELKFQYQEILKRKEREISLSQRS